MTIQFYKNTAAENVVDKTSFLTAVGNAMSGTLRDETSLKNPILLIQTDEVTIMGANYMYITELSRYYYITNIESVRNGLVRVTCKTDVLMTYRTEIANVTGMCDRNQTQATKYIIDDMVKNKVGNDGIVVKMNPTSDWNGFASQQCFALTVIGGHDVVTGS